MDCPHEALHTSPSPHALQAGYLKPNPRQLQAALAASGRPPVASQSKTKYDSDNTNKTRIPSATTFPDPLILPNDDLAADPKYPPQSLRSWIRSHQDTVCTSDRNTIYVAAPPRIGSHVSFIRKWAHLEHSVSSDPPSKATAKVARPTAEDSISTPPVQEVVEYLKAFYHGICVHPLTTELTFTDWDSNTPVKGQGNNRTKHIASQYIALNTPTESTRIRIRPSQDGHFVSQLNINDLLDVAIAVLPEDARALLLFVNHDLYEDEDDDFACGRAYGGSRVAIVSSARYNPALDSSMEVEREHAWPASHCEDYVKRCCEGAVEPGLKSKGRSRKTKATASLNHGQIELHEEPYETNSSPLCAAIEGHKSLPSLTTNPSPETLAGLWLGRVCRTASHELGHCCGIDHCVYYACAMQGTASLLEDARQPPYLCPVDLAKLLRATGADERKRYEALAAFCSKKRDVHLFAAFGAWLERRLEYLES